jgi:hypothetical protein
MLQRPRAAGVAGQHDCQHHDHHSQRNHLCGAAEDSCGRLVSSVWGLERGAELCLG